MEKIRSDRPLVLLLILLAGAVFAAGINWGLPGKPNVEPLLAASATLAQQEHLAGIKVQKDAGEWNDDATRASDVAQHPVADRSRPVTLLENAVFPTDEAIAAQNAGFARLLKTHARVEADFHKTNEEDEDIGRNLHALDVRLYNAREQYLQANDSQLLAQMAQDAHARAEIIRRYRLYSYQPDEMITFRALARMHPDQNDFDPRMYQYGGLWIYPVGGLLKGASLVGWITPIGNTTNYLDHPDQFGQLYIVARAYAALWGMIGVAAVFALLRRLGAARAVAAMGAMAFTLMPVVLDLAHEAKPHLPGTVLILLAILAASNYVRSGKWCWAIFASLLCGLAGGMVLSGLAAIVLIPAMPALRRDSTGKLVGITVAGVIIMAIVYFATNPYVAINLVHNPEVVRSNLANTAAMYPASGLVAGIVRGVLLIAAGTSLPLAVVGLLGALFLVRCKRKPAESEAAEPANGILAMLAVLAVVMLMAMIRVAAGKPGEFGRFALLPDVALLLAAFTLPGRLPQAGMRLALAALLVVVVAGFGAAYEVGFLRDSTPQTSRLDAAQDLPLAAKTHSTLTLLLPDDPAPYNLPPVDLFRWRIVLLPKGEQTGDMPHGLLVRPDDTISLSPLATPLSWANKTFLIESH